MKLPRKYQGITPGEWKMASTGPVMQGYSQPFGIASKKGRNLIAGLFGDGEGGSVVAHSNGMIMADAPRLAAAVVELREALIELSREEYRDDDDPILDRARTRACSAIIATEEWKT